MSAWPPISAIAQKVRTGDLHAAELVEQSLKAMEDNQDYKAVIATIPERARQRAKEIDQKVRAGEPIGRLAGVPFIAKDNFLTFGSETTAASNILNGFRAPYQASAIERLEEAGAICVAKANLDAFAHGSSTENSDFFTTLNPHDKTRVPGGSSGGSSAAVVLELAPFALGTDTGGSIRQPASLCGAVGYKPTYGLVSRSGVVAMASSTDVIGPLARTVADAAEVLEVMAVKDPLDATMIERQSQGYALSDERAGLAGIRIGVIKEYLDTGVEPGVEHIIRTNIARLKERGAEIIEVSLPSLPLALAVYYIICPAEVSSNLARYDGQRYGYSSAEAGDLYESFAKSRSSGFGREAKRRIIIGTYVLSSGYYDAYYRKAQTVRTKLIREFDDAFANVDFLAGPTSPTTAFKVGQRTGDPLQMYLADIMTVAVNLVGIPAVSLPGGTDQGLPVGLQLMAAQRKDRELLELAAMVEEVLS